MAPGTATPEDSEMSTKTSVIAGIGAMVIVDGIGPMVIVDGIGPMVIVDG